MRSSLLLIAAAVLAAACSKDEPANTKAPPSTHDAAPAAKAPAAPADAATATAPPIDAPAAFDAGYTPSGDKPANARRPRPPEVDANALAVGAEMPLFELPTTTGAFALGDAFAKHPYVLVILYRGDWCSFCRTHLQEVQAALPDLDKRGIRPLAISVDPPAVSTKLKDGLALDYPLASDETGAVALQKIGAWDPENELAWPSMWLVGKDRKIVWRYLADAYNLRRPFAELLAEIDAALKPAK